MSGVAVPPRRNPLPWFVTLCGADVLTTGGAVEVREVSCVCGSVNLWATILWEVGLLLVSCGDCDHSWTVPNPPTPLILWARRNPHGKVS